MKKIAKALVLVAAAAHLGAAPLAYSTPAYALAGDVALPAPYVSRALDAVLLPIDDTVRSVFALAADDQGVLVLATEPGGVADSQGVVPGDVIYQVHGHKIVEPIDLDEVVYYWILQGNTDFAFEYYRDGVLSTSDAVITLELYETAVDVTTVSTWTAWSTETSFTYEEFYEEYSVEITESYESSETTIEETVTSEDYSEEVTEEEVTEEEVTEEEVTDEGEVTDDGSAEEEVTEDDGSDDGSEVDDGGEDAAEDDGDA